METFKKSGYPEEWLYLNDPLVVGALLDPAILTLEDYRVEIETRGTFTAGESVGFKKHSDRVSAPLQGIDTASATKDFHPNCKVATEVDVPRFFDLLISRLGREA
jgi:inosine-uridine nucleoside N-ribohydrolase